MDRKEFKKKLKKYSKHNNEVELYIRDFQNPHIWNKQKTSAIQTDRAIHHEGDYKDMRACYQRKKAQAKFNNEKFDLTLDEFIEVWKGKWTFRGKESFSLSLIRIDDTKAWSADNIHLVKRADLMQLKKKI